MKTKLALLLTVTALFTAGTGFAAPRSQRAVTAPKPVPATVSETRDGGCTQMLVRVPGRKTPRTVACSPEACAKIPACAKNCAM